MIKEVSYDQILTALDGVKSSLNNGDSIQVARHRHCGHMQSPLSKAVCNTEEYRDLLNGYLKKTGRHFRFTLKNDKLVFKKKGTK